MIFYTFIVFNIILFLVTIRNVIYGLIWTGSFLIFSHYHLGKINITYHIDYIIPFLAVFAVSVFVIMCEATASKNTYNTMYSSSKFNRKNESL